MSKYYNCCFVSNTVFDNGKIDPNEHPAIIIGNDDKYTYYFMGTTNQKRNNLESPERKKVVLRTTFLLFENIFYRELVLRFLNNNSGICMERINRK